MSSSEISSKEARFEKNAKSIKDYEDFEKPNLESQHAIWEVVFGGYPGIMAVRRMRAHKKNCRNIH